MAYRKKMGKVDTTTMLVLAGAGVLALYLFTRTTTTQTPAGTLITQGGASTLVPVNQTQQDITAGSAGLSQLISAFSDF